VKTVAVPDQPLYDEYGLDATEQADYTYADKHFSATAWRMRDSTGAMALFESRRPPGAIPATPGLLAPIPVSKSAVAARLAVRTSDGVIFVYGNYVFRLTGTVPPAESLQPVYMACRSSKTHVAGAHDGSARRRADSQLGTLHPWAGFASIDSSRGYLHR